ncbi:MAG: hypothetical protein AAB556_00050 [Patescibacteria group bacterium]
MFFHFCRPRHCSIARTIADLAGEKDIKTPHIFEALQYRTKSDVI